MQTTTATQSFGSIPGDLSLEDLYDVIMETIEPDLTSKNIGTLDEKYADETAEQRKARGLRYLDSGTSGGIWGLANGYCLMVGGDRSAYDQCEPLLLSLIHI